MTKAKGILLQSKGSPFVFFGTVNKESFFSAIGRRRCQEKAVLGVILLSLLSFFFRS